MQPFLVILGWILVPTRSLFTGPELPQWRNVPPLSTNVPPPPPGVLPLPYGPPQPPPEYMVNNQGNSYGVAPDKGTMNGPVLNPPNQSSDKSKRETITRRQTGSYWVESIAHGEMPFAPSGYEFFRNVKDFGAKGDGSTDDTAAINRAISSGPRCGQTCGSSSVLGALVYFPNGTYMISTPVIQYYYTQFVGDANNRPTIKGMAKFVGIALIDTDVYIPGGNGNEWYINQNQFYRQIRNFVIDLTLMPPNNTQAGQTYVPTGIHWQVAQATSLQNIHFQMPVSTETQTTTAVGIFMENGSGGFVNDLSFFGGNIGFRAGSQQFTARNLQFTSCLTAISMIWDWGFTWQNINVYSCYVALDCSLFGGLSGQGTGSISVVDSILNYVPYAITTHAQGPTPNIVIDNLLVENSASVVLISGGQTLLAGSSSGSETVQSWSIGRRYLGVGGSGAYEQGNLNPAPVKPKSLLSANGTYFARSKPQYETYAASSIIVATAHGISNAGTGDQTAAINNLLEKSVGSLVFFPAGIYLVQGTVNIPVGTRMVGEGWSQFMATGAYFQNEAGPQVMIRVGKAGDSGIIEISDFLFTVKGPTAGAILVEWNVQESFQGSAGMWDSHFRVGGATGTNLQLQNCPAGTLKYATCKAASLLFHMTSTSSGYFENIWAWTADHDLDAPPHGNTTTATQISVFSGRGLLIESQGPSWFIGSASEHHALYQYQLYGAKNIYLGHMQTETPYYQPDPGALEPYAIGGFPADPTFPDCTTGSSCQEAWALRVIKSNNVFIYSAGFYSFFSNYSLSCNPDENCQEKIMETSYTQGLWLYNIFTRGVVQIISPDGGISPVLTTDDNQSGYTTEVAAFLELALNGANIGSNNTDTSGGSGDVYIAPSIWQNATPTVSCFPPCTLILPPFQLGSTTTITLPPYTTTLEVAWTTTVKTNIDNTLLTSTFLTSISESTVLTPPPVTTTEIQFWNVNVTGTSSRIIVTESIMPPPFTITDNPNPLSQMGVSHPKVTRTITPPPYPYFPIEPTTILGKPTKPVDSSTYPAIIGYTSGAPKAPCIIECGSPCLFFCHPACLINCGDNNGGIVGDNDNCDPLDPNCDEGSNKAACTTLQTATHCTKVVRSFTTMGSRTATTQTHCAIIEACSATPSTTTITITATSSYPTYTESLWAPYFAAEPASLLIAIGNSIISLQSGWDATRFGPMTQAASVTTRSTQSLPSTHQCEIEEDPDSGINTPYCGCTAYPSTLPTLKSTSSPYYACGYTSFPPVPPVTTTYGCTIYTWNTGGNLQSTNSHSLSGCHTTKPANPIPTPGCIESRGEISVNELDGEAEVVIFALYDNGIQRCRNNGASGNGNTITVQCQPGYTIVIDSEGRQMTYSSPRSTEVISLDSSIWTYYPGDFGDPFADITWDSLGSCSNAKRNEQ